jgi:hypothetical protein
MAFKRAQSHCLLDAVMLGIFHEKLIAVPCVGNIRSSPNRIVAILVPVFHIMLDGIKNLALRYVA